MPDYGGTTGFAYDITTPSVATPQDTGQGMQGSTGGGGTFGSGQSQQQINQANQAIQQAAAQQAAAQQAIIDQQAAEQQALMIAFTKKQAALKEENRIKSLYDDLYTAGTGIFSAKPIKTISPNQRALIMQGLGQYSPFEGNLLETLMKQWKDRGALLSGEDQKYRVDKEGNFILDKEGQKQFTKEGVIDYLRGIAPDIPGEEGASVLESMKRDMPAEYYDLMGMPQTTGELENLANIPVTAEMQGANSELAQMIFDARNELDRQQGDQGGGGGQGGGQGIADLGPLEALAEVAPEEEVAAITTPAATPVTTPAAAAPIASINYADMAPQFGPQYPGYNQYPWPNYVNQGLGQWPQFDYWNQIANTFPGMSQYG